jgi:hypothetical protein
VQNAFAADSNKSFAAKKLRMKKQTFRDSHLLPIAEILNAFDCCAPACSGGQALGAGHR